MAIAQRIGTWWKPAALGFGMLLLALVVQGCNVTASRYSSGYDTAYGPSAGYGSVFIGRNNGYYGYRSPHYAFGPPYYRYGPPPAWFGHPRSGYPYHWRCGRYGFHCW